MGCTANIYIYYIIYNDLWVCLTFYGNLRNNCNCGWESLFSGNLWVEFGTTIWRRARKTWKHSRVWWLLAPGSQSWMNVLMNQYCKISESKECLKSWWLVGSQWPRHPKNHQNPRWEPSLPSRSMTPGPQFHDAFHAQRRRPSSGSHGHHHTDAQRSLDTSPFCRSHWQPAALSSQGFWMVWGMVKPNKAHFLGVWFAIAAPNGKIG